jgi:AraC family transcriptional regulator
MILKGFPDINWLKSQIDQGFRQKKGYNNTPLDPGGFPSVIINASVSESYRPDIKGPVSFFLNLSGSSYCKVDDRTVYIPEDYYFISNRSQPYTLTIESEKPIETFNIHFGENFTESVLGSLSITPAQALEYGMLKSSKTITFYNRLYKRDETFNRIVGSLEKLGQSNQFDKLLFEEQLTKLLTHQLLQHQEILWAMDKIPAAKPSVRTELFKRISLAKDYMHSMQPGAIDLNQLAAAACISKYHFLRLFKTLYGMSPHQYIQQIRIDKAKNLLNNSSFAIQEISDSLGFENSQSFSRFFQKNTGVYPTQYRNMV